MHFVADAPMRDNKKKARNQMSCVSHPLSKPDEYACVTAQKAKRLVDIAVQALLLVVPSLVVLPNKTDACGFGKRPVKMHLTHYCPSFISTAASGVSTLEDAAPCTPFPTHRGSL